jgi:hypothetical protein
VHRSSATPTDRGAPSIAGNRADFASGARIAAAAEPPNLRRKTRCTARRRSVEALYIEDIETAGPAMPTRASASISATAPVHAPIYHKGGSAIAGTSSIIKPKKWSAADKGFVADVQKKLTGRMAFVEQDAK